MSKPRSTPKSPCRRCAIWAKQTQNARQMPTILHRIKASVCHSRLDHQSKEIDNSCFCPVPSFASSSIPANASDQPSRLSTASTLIDTPHPSPELRRSLSSRPEISKICTSVEPMPTTKKRAWAPPSLRRTGKSYSRCLAPVFEDPARQMARERLRNGTCELSCDREQPKYGPG